MRCSKLVLTVHSAKEKKFNNKIAMDFRLTFWLVLAFVGLLELKTIQEDIGCTFNKKNYTACTVMLYTKWKPCNDIDCELGLQRREKGVCCPRTGNETVDVVKAACKKNCNLSDSDFFELSKYIPPSTILTSRTSPGAIKTTITAFFPTTQSLTRTLSSTTKSMLFSQTSSKSSKIHGSTIPTTSSKIRGSTVHSGLDKAHVSTVVSAVDTVTVKGFTTSSKATEIKGSQIKTSFVETKNTKRIKI